MLELCLLILILQVITSVLLGTDSSLTGSNKPAYNRPSDATFTHSDAESRNPSLLKVFRCFDSTFGGS